MGLTLQFFIGQREPIIDAVKAFDFDYLERLAAENKMADFSLHLEPNDLNFLVICATQLKNLDEFGLRECLDMTVPYFDSEDGGAYLVDRAIIGLFSQFSENEAAELATNWFEWMAAGHQVDLEVNNDAIEAVGKLIAICKEAQECDLDLVHSWLL